jgi:hypothetical protein
MFTFLTVQFYVDGPSDPDRAGALQPDVEPLSVHGGRPYSVRFGARSIASRRAGAESVASPDDGAAVA